MKRIGVVIPIYNTEKYLRQCIESVLMQKYKNMAIALVDDGSTDNCGKICDEYAKKDNRITVIHQENSDMIAARYRGATAIEYDYLTFVDSDDWIAPNTYEKFTEQMENNIDLISWQFIKYYNQDNQIIVPHNFQCGFYDNERYKTEIYPKMIWIYKKNILGMYPTLCNKLIKKNLAIEAMKKAQAIKNITYGEDVAVSYPLLKETKTLYLSGENLYYYRQKKTNNTPSYFKDEKFFEKLLILHNYCLQIFKNEPHIIKQLDIVYTQRVIRRSNVLNYNINLDPFFLFPFKKIPPEKNIIIYGAGVVGKKYYNSLNMLQYAKNILWVDKNYSQYEDIGVKSIEILKETKNYDYIVVAIEDEKIAKEVISYLSNIPALFQTKIIWNIYKLD